MFFTSMLSRREGALSVAKHTIFNIGIGFLGIPPPNFLGVSSYDIDTASDVEYRSEQLLLLLHWSTTSRGI